MKSYRGWMWMMRKTAIVWENFSIWKKWSDEKEINSQGLQLFSWEIFFPTTTPKNLSFNFFEFPYLWTVLFLDLFSVVPFFLNFIFRHLDCLKFIFPLHFYFEDTDEDMNFNHLIFSEISNLNSLLSFLLFDATKNR